MGETPPQGFLRAFGPVAELQRTELIWAAVIIAVAVLPVLLGVPLILWRYRQRNRDRASYRPHWHFNTKLEVLMWAVPALIVATLSVWLAQATYRIDPYREIDAEMARGMEFEITGPPLRIDVVGLDWKWLFLYPEEGVASIGEMVVPVGRPVRMRLTTDTVMQSFMASGLVGQIYAMPGMVTRLNLLAEREGVTLAENTQYNGPGFPEQRAPVRAVSPEAFAVWTDLARRNPPLDAETYARLAGSGGLAEARAALGQRGAAPLTFTLPDDTLFPRIVARYTNGDPVPPAAQPGSPSYDPAAAALPEVMR
ncbi:cytochrome c oxidase subunit II [Roseivivax sp. CAU 1761]